MPWAACWRRDFQQQQQVTEPLCAVLVTNWLLEKAAHSSKVASDCASSAHSRRELLPKGAAQRRPRCLMQASAPGNMAGSSCALMQGIIVRELSPEGTPAPGSEACLKDTGPSSCWPAYLTLQQEEIIKGRRSHYPTLQQAIRAQQPPLLPEARNAE